ncbi:uncharacterized protein KIAA1614 homolog isoform X2 [Sceloporus undulatus]|uniref:uncharacterized protein KIAA1614 homolog isoform X2 n=1 Tax=Sceloporus undulatus TaxID=8520 RepID=UPI001C4CCC9E|nr:uncharacterized protein KIAA1614 homolog isoform X2 [Sceloporus undulatus]
MDGNFSTERRKVLKSMKQCVKNISRSKQHPESPEDIDNYCPNGPAWVPVGLSGDPSRGTSVLESKVKALKEKKSTINRQAEAPSQERASLKKGKAWKGKSPTDPTSQDAVVEPQAQIRTYLTDVLLDSTDYYPHSRQEESLESIPGNSYVNDFDNLKGSKTEEESINIAWSSPEEFRRLPGRNILDKKSYVGKTTKRTSRSGLYGASSLKDLSCLQKSLEKVNGGEDHLVQARDLESCSSVRKNDTCGMVTTGRLWRTESWDSLGSGGSNATSLSLAERVEKNRSILQEMLSMSQFNSYSSHELHTLHHHKKETPVLGNDEPSNGILANDVDWDSGVSLQDSEGYRDACGISAAEAKNFVLKDGDPHASGNLSDSSSGESSCGQQRTRGPSPSRVRFEDESARDAEVRYLERLQQRQKRVLDSVLLSLGRGPLVSKPDLSDYINGDLQRKENGICKPVWEQQSTEQAGGALTHQSNRGRSEKEMPLVVNKEGKCSACGSYVNKLAARNPDVSVNQTRNDMHKTCNASQRSKHLGIANEHKVLTTSQEDTRTRPLGPKGTPLWILPSRQRVYTERIKETYIGEVTCIDDVDSALDSTTDTSDSYRTDSEEAGTGTNSQQSMFKSQWHSVPGPDSRPVCSSEKETKSMKNKGDRHWGNASYNAHNEEFQDNVPSINKVETGLSANEANNYNVKGASEIKSQENKIASNKAEVYTRGNQPVDLYPLAKKGKAQGHMKGPKAQFREPIPTVHSQQLPSYLASDSLTNSVNRKSSSSHRPTNNLSQVKDPSQQLNKEVAASFNLGDQVPTLTATGKAPSSPMPYRRAVLTGGYKLDVQDPGQVKEANELPVCSLHNIQHACVSQTEEQSGMQSPKMLSKSQLLALSTNNCNNTHAKHQSKTSVISMVKSKEQFQDSQKMRKKHGTPSSSTFGAPPVNPSATGFTAINLSLTTEETNPTTCAQSISREAPVTEAQKTRSAQTSAVQCKPLEIYPEPKKKLYAKKGGSSSSSSSSSTSGLKKFFTTLSQNTKQKLGRFRCYSMEQICAPEPGTPIPTEEPGPGITSSPKLKKAPSLQSLRLVSPFRQPRKASSVQNLQSLLGKTDRSSLYLLGEDEANPNRKAGSQQRRSLSVEDIGSPDLVRTVGRVVEVFPDGTSQLELQRSPQGNFGFRVSSGNGRPDTGIYVQEMADPNTAKLYAGLLGVGDEILEVNGAKVAGLGLAQINELLLWTDTLSVRVLRQRPLRR